MKLIKLLALLIVLILSNNHSKAQSGNKTSEKLNLQISQSASNELISVWIFLKDKGDLIELKKKDIEKQLPTNSIERRRKTFKRNFDLITYYDIPVNESYFNIVKENITKLRRTSRWLNAISAEVTKGQISSLEKLSFVGKIDVVHKGSYANKAKEINRSDLQYDNSTNEKYTLNYGPSLTQNQQINVPALHDMGYNGDGVIICVMDAGFNNLEHQAFSNMEILDAYDFVNNDANVDDEGDMGTGNHGTMTLSTIGGFYEGELIGPAYGASYILAKTENTDSETQIEEDNWVAAMEWAELNYGPDITSTSLGYTDFDDGSWYSPDELDGNTAVITIGADIAASLGILVVNSAGNSGPGATTIGAPADGDSVLAVGAVYSDGTLTGFSSWGPTGDGRIKPEVLAMGSGVVVADVYGNYYTTASGTSFSCPLTAGAAALLVEMLPDASNMEIFEALKTTANNSETPDNQYGWGIIDILAAYNYLNDAPSISHTELPDVNDLTGPYTVSAEIVSDYTFVSGSPELYYRIDQGNWQNVSMDEVTKGAFEAEISGTGNSSTYDYYIKAENTETTAFLPANAPETFFSFTTEDDGIIESNTGKFGVIYPNPASEYLIVSFGDRDATNQVTIYDAVGQTVKKIETLNKTLNIDLRNTQSGVYFCKMKSGKEVLTKKLIIN